MTPQERQLVDDLFDRLSKVESAPRDPDAASAIAQGLRVAPNAVYALVQTVLVQDEALKRANSRIQELEAGSAPAQNQSGGFLDSMRDTIFGQGQPHGSVPNVRPPEIPNRPTWNSGQVLQQAQGPGQYRDEPYQQDQYRQDQYRQDGPPRPYRQDQYRQDQYRQEPYGAPYGAPQSPMGGGGGSFLGTAAAAAAGAVGGSLLLEQHPLDDGRRQPSQLRRSRRESATSRPPKIRGAINPAAAWRVTPASTTSVHRHIAPMTVRARDCSIPRRKMTPMTSTMTIWISIRMISAAMETAITPDGNLPARRLRLDL